MGPFFPRASDLAAWIRGSDESAALAVPSTGGSIQNSRKLSRPRIKGTFRGTEITTNLLLDLLASPRWDRTAVIHLAGSRLDALTRKKLTLPLSQGELEDFK